MAISPFLGEFLPATLATLPEAAQALEGPAVEDHARGKAELFYVLQARSAAELA